MSCMMIAMPPNWWPLPIYWRSPLSHHWNILPPCRISTRHEITLHPPFSIQPSAAKEHSIPAIDPVQPINRFHQLQRWPPVGHRTSSSTENKLNCRSSAEEISNNITPAFAYRGPWRYIPLTSRCDRHLSRWFRMYRDVAGIYGKLRARSIVLTFEKWCFHFRFLFIPIPQTTIIRTWKW